MIRVQQAKFKGIIGAALCLASLIFLGLAVLCTEGYPAAEAVAYDASNIGVIQIRPSLATVDVGGNVTVEVWLMDVGNYYGIDFRLSFDKNLVSVPSGQVTPLWELFDPVNHFIIKNQADSENGTIWYAVTNLNPAGPFTGTGRLCSITFSGLTTGTTALNFYYAKGSTRDGDPLYPRQLGGAIEVGSPPAHRFYLYLPIIWKKAVGM
ncbi:MAG: hypothetical protein H5T64_12840 [Chloroflexi bacterium]|nr:hypothetical protein [Chloroflexota bacterium]